MTAFIINSCMKDVGLTLCWAAFRCWVSFHCCCCLGVDQKNTVKDWYLFSKCSKWSLHFCSFQPTCENSAYISIPFLLVRVYALSGMLYTIKNFVFNLIAAVKNIKQWFSRSSKAIFWMMSVFEVLKYFSCDWSELVSY